MCFRILNLVGKKQYKTNKQQTNKTPQNFYPNKSLSNSYNSKMEIRLSSGGIRHLEWEQCPTHNVASGGGAAPLTSCIPLCDGSFLPGCKSAAESHSKNNRRQDQTPQVARAPHYHSTSTVPFSKAAPESQLCCSCFLASHSLLSPFQAGFRPYRRAGNSFVKTSVSDYWSILDSRYLASWNIWSFYLFVTLFFHLASKSINFSVHLPTSATTSWSLWLCSFSLSDPLKLESPTPLSLELFPSHVYSRAELI